MPTNTGGGFTVSISDKQQCAAEQVQFHNNVLLWPAHLDSIFSHAFSFGHKQFTER